MSLHICLRCRKEFKFPYLLKKHNERKYPCNEFKKFNVKKTNLNQPKPTQTNLNQPKPTLKKNEISENLESNVNNQIISVKYINCEYCKKVLHKNMITRHLRNGCLIVPKAIKIRLIEKFEKNKNHIKALELRKTKDQNSKVVNNTLNANTVNNNKNSNNTTNNTVNKNTNTINTTNNITNNNITLKIHPLGDENLDFLKNSDIVNIINRCYMAIPEMIMKIHDRPENHNFFIPNFNKKEIAYLGENNQLEYNNYNEICEQIINKNIERLDSYYYKFEKQLTKHIKKRMKNVMRENNNEELNKKYMKNIKYYLMNVSKKNKIALTNFIEKIEKQIM